jgi:Tfp pilus assembly protein PilX
MHARQHGVVLIVAIIVLIAMTLAGIALMRSVDTTNLVAGNLAFQQAATHAADRGIENAITYLENNRTGNFLDSDHSDRGYFANGNDPARSPDRTTNPIQTWDAYWTGNLVNHAYPMGEVMDKYKVSYVIDRMCNLAGAKTGGAGCVSSPVVSVATGNAEEGGEIQLNAPSVVYYRITARVTGPRNTVSYVQAVVSM